MNCSKDMNARKRVNKVMGGIFSAVVLIGLSNNFAFAGRFGSIMLVGNLKGGKTQIFRCLCGRDYNGDDPNVVHESTEATHTILDLKDDQNQPVAITRLYDTPGMDIYYDAVVEMARHCNIAVIVHDTTQEIDEGGEEGRRRTEYFSNLFRDLHDRMPDGGQIFLAGSKLDGQYAKPVRFAKNFRLLNDISQAFNCRLCFVSAKTGEGLGDLMNHIKTALSGINLPVADTEDTYTKCQLIPDPKLTGRIDVLTADKARLEAEKAQLNARIAALNGQVNTLNGQKTRVENEKAALNGQVNTLNNDKQFLQTRKGELESENSTLRSKISALEGEKAQLERDKSGLNSRIRSLEEDLRISRGKEKTGWDYLPIIGTFNIK